MQKTQTRLGNIPEEELFKLWKRIPLSVVECIIVKGKKVLLIPRTTFPYKGMWHLPGGLIHYGESFDNAVKRVVEGETGLELKKHSFHSLASAMDKRGQVLQHFYVCNVAGNPKIGRFFEKDEIPSNTVANHRKKLKVLI